MAITATGRRHFGKGESENVSQTYLFQSYQVPEKERQDSGEEGTNGLNGSAVPRQTQSAGSGQHLSSRLPSFSLLITLPSFNILIHSAN
jgi:hypothetical protein